jgi:hypothetical protein
VARRWWGGRRGRWWFFRRGHYSSCDQCIYVLFFCYFKGKLGRWGYRNK